MLCDQQCDFFIGDCYGVDSLVQFLLQEIGYKNVYIYTTRTKARINLGGWKEVYIKNSKQGTPVHYEKEMAMIYKCDFGLVIWNGKSRGTGNNIIGLKTANKNVCVFYENNPMSITRIQ